MILRCCIVLALSFVLVHGARPQIDANLAENHIETPMADDASHKEAMLYILKAVGLIRLQIEAQLSMDLPTRRCMALVLMPSQATCHRPPLRYPSWHRLSIYWGSARLMPKPSTTI